MEEKDNISIQIITTTIISVAELQNQIIYIDREIEKLQDKKASLAALLPPTE